MSETLRLAASHHAARRWVEAEALYRQALVEQPGSVAALYPLGLLALRTGRPSEALGWLEAALLHAPEQDAASIHAAMAAAFRRLGDGARALGHYRVAAALQPASAPAALNLGAALADAGLYAEAATALARALRYDERLSPAREALAVVLNRLGRHEEARAVCCADGVTPSLSLQRSLGVALKEQGRLGEAAATFQAVLRRAPDDLETAYNLAGVLKDRGRTDEAIAAFGRIIKAAPDHAAARLALCMACLPPLYRDDAEVHASRSAYGEALRALAAWAQGAAPDALAEAVGASQPFYLAYQGEDDLELQRLYGGLVCRAMQARYPPLPLARRPRAGERLRVGIVSGFFRDHANWRMPVGGWVEGLDRTRFELIGYHTSAVQDALTPAIAAAFDHFVQGPLSTVAWRERIAADAPHVLIYPEIGMDPAAVRLAAQRLAPVQCNSWGHPVTSGLPTLDYFLSSEDMEPPYAEASYTERLVRLPGMSTGVTLPAAPPAADRRTLGLRPAATVFWCGQSPYKYLPRHDEVFARIAERVGDCQFVFVAFPGSDELTARFRERLRNAFAARGLDAGRACVILPRMSAQGFRSAMRAADVVLDSLDWSGCNSIVDALACGLPVVSLEGAFLRGRHAAALLRRAGRGDCVVQSVSAYIDLAVQLPLDPYLRRSLSSPPPARLAAAFDGTQACEALGDFLQQVVATAFG